ncbi:MAG: hypothetical protein R3F38_12745 [Gammaproteobacteria bacterium]|jgi:hypothetical protein
MRTTSTTTETQFVEEVDEVLMDDIDGEIEKRLDGKGRRSGDYLRKIEALMEERRLQRELDLLDDDYSDEDDE